MADSAGTVVPAERDRRHRAGLLYALAAFGMWGLVPVYFKAISDVSALEILGHRVLWSVVILAVVVSLRGLGSQVVAAVTDPKSLRVLLVTTVLIAGNWYLFIWAVFHERVLEASLGYFINPLVNIFLGVVFLHERLNRAATIAVVLAAVGVGYLTVVGGELPWVALTLAFSFGLYGLLRKTARAGAVVGLTVETLLMLPAAAGYLLWLWSRGELAFGAGAFDIDLLLAAAGVVTTVPLLCFTAAARLLPLSTLGFLQYLAPSLHFLLAVVVYNEPLRVHHVVAFSLIWTALGVFSADQARLARVERRREAQLRQ